MKQQIVKKTKEDIQSYKLLNVSQSGINKAFHDAIDINKDQPVFIKRYLNIDPKNERLLSELNKTTEIYKINEKQNNLNVVTIYESFFFVNNGSLEYWTVMEKCVHDNLQTYIKEKHHIFGDNSETHFFLCDLSYAVEFLSVNYNIHLLSLIPSHIVLTKDPASPFPVLKLINFVQLFPNLPNMFNMDPIFHPPEYLYNQLYRNSSLWSIGVLLYYLVFGKYPWGNTHYEVFESVRNNKPIEIPEIGNPLLEDLLRKLLVCDPNKRILLDHFFQHPFVLQCRNEKWNEASDSKNYVIEKVIGSGQFGKVFAGRNMRTGEIVALKRIDGKDRNDIIKEARIMKMCTHRNVVNYIDFFDADESFSAQFDEPEMKINNEIINNKMEEEKVQNKNPKYSYLVMEYCELGTLEHYRKHLNRPLNDKEIRHFLSEICSGLSYIHFNKRLVHRDLKLENFLLKQPTTCSLPRLKISDYGFARLFETETDLLKSHLGTVLYMSPEILQGQTYTVKSDLYSLGVILYVLATYQFPFGDEKETFFRNMSNQTPLTFPDNIMIDEQLKDLISHLITYNEDDRLSWEECFKHPYVVMSMQQNGGILSTSNDSNLKSDF